MTSLEKAYLKWLYPQVYREKHKTYWHLFQQMLETEFVWLVPNDDNRISDGLEIRHEYTDMTTEPVSVLEVLVGLSRRLAFTTGDTQESWAWQLIENLELHKFADPVTVGRKETVSIILEHLIWRTYQPDGVGGFFPLAFPKQDQREVEIWYQMSAYLEEIPD